MVRPLTSGPKLYFRREDKKKETLDLDLELSAGSRE